MPTAKQLEVSKLGELWVKIGPASTESTASVTLTTRNDGTLPVEITETRTINVMPWEDTRASEAQPYFDFWVDWLAENHPEFGITTSTPWQSTFVSALLIVSKYAYWSTDWEMVVAWHVMVAPDDFTEVYLRNRAGDVLYTDAFRQDSFSQPSTPHPVTPPDTLIR